MKKRLLMICPNDPRRAEAYVGTQIAALREFGWDAICAFHASGQSPQIGGMYRALPVEPTRAPATWTARALKFARTAIRKNAEEAGAAEMKMWRQFIRETDPDCILVQFGPVAARMLPALRACGVPWAVQFHGYDLTQRCSHWGYRRTLGTLMSAANAAFVPSAFLEAELGKYTRAGDTKKIFRITPGYDEAMFVKLPRPPRQRGVLRLASVGRLVPVKGHRYVIEAVARAGDGIELVIAGEGEERAALARQIAALGLEARIRLGGMLPAAEIVSVFRNSDAFIQLSTATETGAKEGLGLSAIEAAATGLPIIVSDSGGLRETCRDGVTGVVVPDRDIDAAAAALRALRDDPHRAEAMGAAGAAWVAATFASHRQAMMADAVLKRL